LSLKIYDTLEKKKKIFKPQKGKVVKMYVCGPTVYGPDHLGHARMGVFYDTLRKYLEYKGYQVKMVQNITDVGHLSDDADMGEDKIERAAKEEAKTPAQIAEYYTKRHFNDMDKLNVSRPTFAPKASEYIPQMIKAVEELIDKGYAYESGGNVYYDVSKFKKYGQLSGKKPDDLINSVRVEEDKKKKSPLDFALWLKAEPAHLQKWESPWSRGYPGWHLECSVMNRELLGETIDIHGGAIELAFPHHENELAQSEVLNQKKFVRYWVHIGMVQVDGVKMGKSKGNFITIRNLLKKYSGDQIRLGLLLTHYKKPFDYTSKRLNTAGKILARLLKAKNDLKSNSNNYLRAKFEEIMDNNLNTPALISFWLENLDKIDEGLFEDIQNILGLKLVKPEVPDKIIKLAEQREQLREKGNYNQADKLRKKIKKEGFVVEDKDKGYEVWRQDG
jgi:cysteinyl-tRNA synthetase